MWTFICSVFLVLCLVGEGFGATRDEERKSNSIFIRYNDVSLERWNDDPDNTGIDNTAAVKAEVSKLANKHCRDDPDACSLASVNTEFMAKDVMLSDSSPEVFNGDLKLTFAVSIQGKDVDDTADTQYFLPKAALTEICEDDDGQEALKNATNGKFTVDFVNNNRVSPPIDNTMNKIMIPISIVLLLIMVIATFILHFYHKRKDEKEHLPTGAQGGNLVMTEVKTEDGGQGAGKSDDEPGPTQGLLKGEEEAAATV